MDFGSDQQGYQRILFTVQLAPLNPLLFLEMLDEHVKLHMNKWAAYNLPPIYAIHFNETPSHVCRVPCMSDSRLNIQDLMLVDELSRKQGHPLSVLPYPKVASARSNPAALLKS